jgi:short subunit dehydrogenase-like uncharacterized protein
MTRLDVLVWGATGFVGQIVAEYLAQQYGSDELLRVGLGGRSLAKLEDVRRRCAAVHPGAKVACTQSHT